MVCPGRDRLSGTVEVDETYWGAEESGQIGRLSVNKAIIAVAVEGDGRIIGRVRLQAIPNLTQGAVVCETEITNLPHNGRSSAFFSLKYVRHRRV